MNSFNANAHDFRLKRKCFSMTGCLIFVLLMSQASCRPSENDDVPTYNDGDYTDADDIEWQNFPIAETTTKGHPIIYYKEDIVSEDYDPNKENKSSSSKEDETEIKPPTRRRKYKEISRRNRLNRTESYRYIKPEKVYFDVYPIEDDGIKEDDSKFNEDDIHVEVISLLDDNNNNNEESTESKRLLSKKSKKYSRRHRQRRDVTETDETAEHSLRHKRNPFSFRVSYYGNQLPQYRGVFYQPQVVIYPVKSVKHPIKGIYYNAVSPGGGAGNLRPGKRITTTTSTTVVPPTIQGQMPDIKNRIDFEDKPVWDSYPMTATTQSTPTGGRPEISEITTRPPRRPAPPIIHTGDEDYVPSSNRNPITRPPSRLPVESSAIEQQFRPQPIATQPPRPIIRTTTPPPPPPPPRESTREISACIWAISSCCTRSENIRYQCFERLGCSGAFWDLNPCADDIFRLAVEAADQYFV